MALLVQHCQKTDGGLSEHESPFRGNQYVDGGQRPELINLCERSGIKYGSLARALHRYWNPTKGDRLVSLDFRLADAILCAMGRVDLWYSEMADYYFGVNLDALPERDRGAEIATCRRGHELTPENTLVVSNGRGTKRRCRTCHREDNRARRMSVSVAA